MPAHQLRYPGGGAIFDPAAIAASELEALVSARPERRGATLPGVAGREGVRLIESAGRRWVWRHNCRGGWCRRFSRDRYLWIGESRIRTFREWHLLDHLNRVGLPVPPPVAAVYRRHGPFYSCDLVTGFLAGTASLGARLRSGEIRAETWVAVGACIRRFHAGGVNHADLNAENVLIDWKNRVYLVDFDRGRLRRPGPWVDDNWKRLRRSVTKLTEARKAPVVPSEMWLTLRA